MDHNDGSWVDARMQALDPPQAWQPDSAAALEGFRRMRRQADVARRWRIGLGCAAAAACLVAVFIWPRAFPPTEDRRALIVSVGFRETGSPSAPILAEIYSDYQCGHCARLQLETLPRLMADYVATGKVRLMHRDLPLPQHAYARQAARYANAAGTIGRYEAVADLLFRTQRDWSADGDLDSRLKQVLSSAEMQQVRGAVRDSAKIDAAIEADTAMAIRDDVRETPTLVVVANGRRRTLAPVPPYPLLKSYLDEQLKINCHENPKASLC